MDIDPYLSNWVLEFLFRQDLSDNILNSLLTLPLPNNNPNLQKLILLKKLESDASKNSISERTLELLEQLEEIDFAQGVETASEAMKRAYCLIAVECTVRHLRNDDDWENNGRFKFFETVRKVWREKIGGMEKGILCSEDLFSWKDDIEAAIYNDKVCQNVLKKSKLVDLIEAIGTYVREEREKMGPSFLELVAEKAKDDKVLQEVLGVGSVDQVVEEDVAHSDSGRGAETSVKDKEVQVEKIQHRKKRPRGAKITDSDENEMSVGPSVRDYVLTGSAEVKKLRQDLESSVLELQAVVTDPLPDALNIAEEIAKNKNNDPIEKNQKEINMFIVDSQGVVQSILSNLANVPNSSFMQRNRSAHTYEWESPERSQEGSPDVGTRPRLPSLKKKQLVSPLKKYDLNGIKARRKKLKWSNLEEDTLRAGVEQFGKGYWKLILTKYPDIFEDRTEVDLKDKWRNMTRY